MNFQQTRVKPNEKGGNAAHRTQRGTLFQRPASAAKGVCPVGGLAGRVARRAQTSSKKIA
jgi:hypothetical protein